MATRNHYAVLGVPRTESAGGIRAAFRDLVKRHHPDRAGVQDANRFREIVDAYRALADPEIRRAYDEDLRRHEQGDPVRIRRGRPVGAGWAEPEPLVPEPLDVFGAPEEIRPSFDALFERMLRNFTGRGVPKAERPEAITCQVLLTPEEAARGGVLPIQFPVFEPCASCGGSGHTMLFPCLDCSASGIVEVPATVRIRIPPGVASGSRFTTSLSGIGIGNLVLEVLIRVGR
jgi:DnaJ-class molecular chaperone